MNPDLHLHTTASDGELPPEAVVGLLASLHYDLIAITDHDTIGGVKPAIAAAESLDTLRVLPGLELSSGGDLEVHLLAYGINPEHQALNDYLAKQRMRRRERLLEMHSRLTRLGMVFEWALPTDDRESAGRPHLARAMVRAGYAESTQEAFDRWLGQGKAAYVPRETPKVRDAIDFLRQCGGVVSLAHPGELHMGWDGLLHCLPGWCEAGLQALEAYHSAHAPGMAMQFDRLARRHGLLVTGGSDFHGSGNRHVRPGDGLAHWTSRDRDAQKLCALFNF